MATTDRDKASVGKWLGHVVYVHKSALKSLPSEYWGMATQALQTHVKDSDLAYNVVKIDSHNLRVSLLEYNSFRSDPFPSLETVITVDLHSGVERKRSYRESSNPPILHRKELLLDPDDPDRVCFAQLTRQLEQAGMYKNPGVIGFRKNWAERLSNAGLHVKGHFVISRSASSLNGEDKPW